MKHNKAYGATKVYMYHHRGFSINQFHRIVMAYGKYKQLPNEQLPGIEGYKAYIDEVCDVVQQDWKSYLDFVRASPIKPKMDRKQRRQYYGDYNDMREALQYTNGSTDNF
jgi:hypothetical protein